VFCGDRDVLVCLTSLQLPQDEVRKIIVPSRRIGPLKEAWTDLISPLVSQMGLQVRFNTQTKQIELKIGPATKDIAAIQKGQDYCRAFVLGFELKDCVALLRMDDLFIDGFDGREEKEKTLVVFSGFFLNFFFFLSSLLKSGRRQDSTWRASVQSNRKNGWKRFGKVLFFFRLFC
jgi:hypothetical protein